MKLGVIARCDNSGLGIQTWEFVKHMKPYRTMVVDISKLNGNKQYYERYPENSFVVKGFPTNEDIELLLADVDVVFVAESAYNPYLYIRARQLGVKVANQYNYEFFDWFDPATPTPDMFIAPSKWHYEDVHYLIKQNAYLHLNHIYLPLPLHP